MAARASLFDWSCHQNPKRGNPNSGILHLNPRRPEFPSPPPPRGPSTFSRVPKQLYVFSPCSASRREQLPKATIPLRSQLPWEDEPRRDICSTHQLRQSFPPQEGRGRRGGGRGGIIVDINRPTVQYKSKDSLQYKNFNIRFLY